MSNKTKRSSFSLQLGAVPAFTGLFSADSPTVVLRGKWAVLTFTKKWVARWWMLSQSGWPGLWAASGLGGSCTAQARRASQDTEQRLPPHHHGWRQLVLSSASRGFLNYQLPISPAQGIGKRRRRRRRWRRRRRRRRRLPMARMAFRSHRKNLNADKNRMADVSSDGVYPHMHSNSLFGWDGYEGTISCGKVYAGTLRKQVISWYFMLLYSIDTIVVILGD